MNVQYFLELLGTFVFAISGALAIKGMDKDWLSAGFTGFITAIGGGTLRDILLDRNPLAWISDINILYVVIAAVVFTYFFSATLGKLRRTLFLFDTLGISLFAIVGTEVALEEGVRAELAAIMGMLTAVMGGVIRDTLTKETPIILQRGMYASACLIGSIIYVFMDYLDIGRNINFLVAIFAIIFLRIMAVRYHWAVPSFDNADERKQS